MELHLGELLEKQVELDEMIIDKKEITDTDLTNYKLMALIAEVGEAINEYRAFKYWSEDREIRTGKLLEELADCLHFILSIASDIGYATLPVLKELPNNEAVVHDPITDFLVLSNISSEIAVTKDFGLFENLLDEFIGVVISCGFSLEALRETYLSKNKMNKIRQHSGY